MSHPTLEDTDEDEIPRRRQKQKPRASKQANAKASTVTVTPFTEVAGFDLCIGNGAEAQKLRLSVAQAHDLHDALAKLLAG